MPAIDEAATEAAVALAELVEMHPRRVLVETRRQLVLGFLNFLLFAYLIYYVFRSMRAVYGESRLRTSLKFTALAMIYFVLLGVTMLAGLAYSALALA